jgi:penicillin amidase
MQVGHAHTTDYYIEDQSDVVFDRLETIIVAGGSPVIIPVYRTPHGPLVNPLPYNPGTYNPGTDGPFVSWKYAHAGYEFQTLTAYLGLARAKSMDEFGAALEGVAVSQHFCYADRDGNIAYWMSGRDPQRDPGEWRLPQGALGTTLEWDASMLIPRSTDRNTPAGYYCGWNNKSSAAYNDPPNSVSYLFGQFHRAHVIDDVLAAGSDLSFDQVRDLALFIATTDSFGGGGNPWPLVKDYFTAGLSNSGTGVTPERQALIDLMNSWDGHFVEGGPDMWAFGPDRSDAWMLMNAWIREVIRLTFEDELTFPGETALKNTYRAENVNRLFNVLLHSLAGSGSGVVNTYDWFSNLEDGDAPQTPEEIISTALDNALVMLGDRPWGTDERGGHRVQATISSVLCGPRPSPPGRPMPTAWSSDGEVR